MLQIVQINQKFPAKKISVFKELPTGENDKVITYLKPGDKLKMNSKSEISFGGKFSEKEYVKVVYHGEEGWIANETILEG